MRLPAGQAVTVVVATIPPRAEMLKVALDSVFAQRHPADVLAVAIDHRREGAARTRTRAALTAQTEWTAFLDDDDRLYPQHLGRLVAHALDTGADVVYPWFDVEGGSDPFPQFEGKSWDPDAPHIFPITALVRTALVHEVGAFWRRDPLLPDDANVSGEDWAFWLACAAAGGHVEHLAERTWCWVHHSGNTAGLARRW